MAEREKCAKCPRTVRAPGQRYCDACHAEAQKRYRDTHVIVKRPTALQGIFKGPGSS